MRNLKRALSLTLASVMLLGMMVVGSSAASYPDVEDTHNVEAIEVLKAVKVMVGDDNGNFGPDDQVNRAQMAVVMALLLDLDYDYYKGTNPFWDVPSWAEPYVAACYANGIVSGYNATTYGAGDPVTAVQAASMMMRALGYFKYQSDYKDGFELSTVRQASKISLFKDVNASGNNTALTRNQVAQLALNTLEATVVDAKDNTLNISGESGGMSMSVTGGQVDYVVRTSSDYKVSQSINWVERGNTETDGKTGYTVELGEQLYQGDLRKTPDYDDFNRPVNTWSYKSTEIGKYIDDSTVNGTWTGKVTEKDLYNAVGSAAYNDYAWSVYQNGGLIAADTVGSAHAGRTAAIPHGRTSTERVLTTGTGVLTQVFVDNERDIVVLSMIDTGVARVTRVDEVDDGYEVTVAFRTRVANGQHTEVNPDNKFTTSTQFNRDDIVIYTASEDTDEIESMAVAQTVTGKVTAQKNADYTVLDGTTYNYNYAYTRALNDTAKGVYNGIGKGLYNLEDGVAAQDPSVDKEVTLYLDAYGNAVAYEGKAATAEDYLFVTEKGQVFTSEPSAKVVFYDGTKATINVDKIIVPSADGKSSTNMDAVTTGGNNKTTRTLNENTIYKYSKGSSTYDLEEVSQDTITDGKGRIKKDNPTIGTDGGTGTAVGAVTNGSTVFVDAENGKAWTGYQNVTTKNNAKVALVKDKNSISEIVFIYGDFTSEAADDDFIVLSGTGYEVLKNEDGKTYYRMTSAYDVHGEKLTDCSVASESEAKQAVKGLMKVTRRDGDDYISNWDVILTAINEVGLDKDGNPNATRYATSAKEQVLKLDGTITFNGQNKATFSYNGDTEFVVIDLKKGNGDVERVRSGSIDDIEAWEAPADGVDNTDLTGVYVMTIDDSSKDAPLAKTVLVVVPNNGSDGADAGNENKPGAGNDAEELTSYSTVDEVNAALKNGNVKINGTWNPEDADSQNLIIPTGKTLEIVGNLNFGTDGKVGFANKTSSVLVVSGTLTLNQATIDGVVDAGSLVLKETTAINANVTVDTNATCTKAGESVTIASGVTVKIGGNFTGNNTGTLTNNGHLEVTGDITGWQNANEFSTSTMIARSITVTGTFTIGKSGNAGSVRIPTITAPTVAIANGTVSATTVTATTSVTVTEGSLNATGTVTTPAATVSAGAQATVGTLTVATSLTMGENAKLTVNTKLNGTAATVTGAAGATVSFGEGATAGGAIAEKFTDKNGSDGTNEGAVGGNDYTWTVPSGGGEGSMTTDKETVDPIAKLDVAVAKNAGEMIEILKAHGYEATEAKVLSITGAKDIDTANAFLTQNPYVFVYWERAAGVKTEGKNTDIVIKSDDKNYPIATQADWIGTFGEGKDKGSAWLYLFTQVNGSDNKEETGVAGVGVPTKDTKVPITVTWKYAGQEKTAEMTYTYTAPSGSGAGTEA